MTEPNRQIFGFHLFIRALVWTKRVKQSMRSDNPAAPRSTSIDLSGFGGGEGQSVSHPCCWRWMVHTHTHKHTSARPHLNPETANQLQASGQTLHLHYAWSRESWEAAAESSSLRMFTPPCVCVCVLGPAWGSRHEPLWGKPSSSSLPPLCSLYETIKMRSINIDDCNFVFVCQNVQLSKFKFKFNNYWNTTEE